MKRSEAIILFLFFTLYASAQKLKPALNLNKGSTYSLLIKQTITTNQTIRQLPLETRLLMMAKISFTVTGVIDTIYHIKTNYDSLSLQIDLPNGNLQFSSERADTGNLYAKALAGLKALPFQITLSKSGRVLVADEAVKNLLQVINNLPADTAQQQQAFKQLQPLLGADAIKSLIENVLRIFPPVAIDKTNKWDIERTIPGEPPLLARNFYFINNTSPAEITIQGNGTAQSVAPTDMARLNGMPVKRDLAGTTTSAITISRKTGWPKSAELIQSLKGNIIIADNPKLPGGIAIPVTINSSLTVRAL